MNSLNIPYSSCVTIISWLGVPGKEGDGAGFVPDEKPKDTVQLMCYITAISCLGVWDKGGKGAGFVPDEQP